MSGRCPTSGLVCLRGERQGAGAWAAPGPLHPLPRVGAPVLWRRAGTDGTAPSAHAVKRRAQQAKRVRWIWRVLL